MTSGPARNFLASARKLQTTTGQCSTPTGDAHISPSRVGRTTRSPSAGRSAATPRPTTRKAPLTSAYTTRQETPGECKELPCRRKETASTEQGNRGTGEQGNRGSLP